MTARKQPENTKAAPMLYERVHVPNPTIRADPEDDGPAEGASVGAQDSAAATKGTARGG